MQKIFDKSKVLNYITAGIYLISAVIFIKQLSFYLWQFDIFNMKQVGAFLKYIATGKVFGSLKYISFIITFIGLCFITYAGIVISMNFEFLRIKPDVKSDDAEKSITQEALKNATLEVEKSITNTNEEEKKQEEVEVKENPVKSLQEISEERFAMYNGNNQDKTSLVKEELIEKEETPLQNNEVGIPNSTEEDRAKLQAKIKEIMQRMKERREEEYLEIEQREDVQEDKKEKILEPVKFSQNNNLIDMNFKNISEKENAQMEQTLISSGFKLLSEIRIGSTGIDYLGVAKDKLVVVQLDTTEGNWFASEDKVEGNDAPVWFSELGNKISPVARAIEAKNNIAELINGKIDLPIESVACLSRSKVVNIPETIEDWEKLQVKVVQLEKSNDEMETLSSIEEIYPQQSQEDVDESVMNKLISILEKAEIPE